MSKQLLFFGIQILDNFYSKLIVNPMYLIDIKYILTNINFIFVYMALSSKTKWTVHSDELLHYMSDLFLFD